MSPRVSVIVAARDAVDTLGATLDSVRAQSFEDWEVVVVDDGSADGTGALARSFGERVRVLRNEPAGGPATARNRGIREARGELIATLDADDAWKPEYLERQVALYDEARTRGRRVGVVCCDADYVREDGPAGLRWNERVMDYEHIDLTLLLRENVVFSSVLGPREAFLDVGGYDEDPRMQVEDYDLWVRMAERGWEFVANPEALGICMLRPGGMTSNTARMAVATRLMFDRALERGALSPAQRRVARKRRRVFRVVELRARMADESDRPRQALLALRAAPLIAVSALEHPERWRRWIRHGPRSAGARRHTG